MSVLKSGEEHIVGQRHVVDERGVSSDGERIFFDTADPLVPQDVNTGTSRERPDPGSSTYFEPQGRDVYEWENGTIYLISSGKSPEDSYFLDSSANGNDVFFATSEGVVPGDTDGAYDVYDARVPHPGDSLPPAAVPCEGSVCQGPPNVPALLTPPASATFSGLGNAAPAAEPEQVKPKVQPLTQGREVRTGPEGLQEEAKERASRVRKTGEKAVRPRKRKKTRDERQAGGPGVLSSVMTTCAVALGPSSASAARGPVWKILAVSNPTNLRPGDHTGDDALVLAATNVGGGSSDGSAITLSDSVPAGLTATAIYGNESYKDPKAIVGEEPDGTGGMHCSLGPTPGCTTTAVIDPGDTLIVTIRVDVASELAPSLSVEIHGVGRWRGERVGVRACRDQLCVPGIRRGSGRPVCGHFDETGRRSPERDYSVLSQHQPSDARHGFSGSRRSHRQSQGRPLRSPPGLVGTTVGMPRCTMAAVIAEAHCPADTMIGTATVIALSPLGRLNSRCPCSISPRRRASPRPSRSTPLLFPARLDTSVLSSGDYAVRVTAPDLTEGAQVLASWVTIWGVPADHAGAGSDLAARNLSAGQEEFTPQDEIEFGGPGVGQTRVPLLSNPSQCSTSLEAILESDSWEGAGPGVFAKEGTSLGADTGCGELTFRPEVSMLPDTLEAGAPAGYSFDLACPRTAKRKRWQHRMSSAPR